MKSPLRIVIVGSLSNVAIGGTMVSLLYLVKSLRSRSDVDLKVIDTGGIRGCGVVGAMRLLRVFFCLLWIFPRSQVVGVHLAFTAVSILSPIIIPLARLFDCPIHLRIFGGIGWKRDIELKWLKTYCSVLLQTKALCEQASQVGLRHVEWFPTSRSLPESLPMPRAIRESAPYRLLFVATVKPEKGINYLLELMQRLTSKVTLDLYGPLSGVDTVALASFDNVNYCGCIEPSEVPRVMLGYDLLILPTYHEDEGYPGVIIEAFAVGLPVVTTYWKQIPELAEGVACLIPPHDAEALNYAVDKLLEDSGERVRLREAGLQRAQEFSSEKWADFYLNYCRLQAR